MSDNNARSGGISFAGLLTILFIGLKLTDSITWSWVWVLSPIWITFGLAMAILVVAFVLALVFNTREPDRAPFIR